MKNTSITHIRYAKDRTRFVANLAISLWFPGAKAEIDKTGSEKRKSQWARLDPWNMKIEPPVIFSSDEFTSCIVDRKAGILLKDKSVPLISFDTFLKESMPSTNGGGEVKTDVKLNDLYTQIQNLDSLSATPVFYLANIDGSAEYTIVYDSKSVSANLDGLVSGIFRDYDFESIVISALDKNDDDAAKLTPVADDVTSFYTGKVSVADKVLKEKSITFNFIDLNLLATVISMAKRNKPDNAQAAKQSKGKPSQRDAML